MGSKIKSDRQLIVSTIDALGKTIRTAGGGHSCEYRVKLEALLQQFSHFVEAHPWPPDTNLDTTLDALFGAVSQLCGLHGITITYDPVGKVWFIRVFGGPTDTRNFGACESTFPDAVKAVISQLPCG